MPVDDVVAGTKAGIGRRKLIFSMTSRKYIVYPGTSNGRHVSSNTGDDTSLARLDHERYHRHRMGGKTFDGRKEMATIVLS